VAAAAPGELPGELERMCGHIRLRSATSINYSVPRTRTKFGDRAFSVAGPVVRNSIPAAVRDADTVSSFKRKLKTHFFLCASTMFDFYRYML